MCSLDSSVISLSIATLLRFRRRFGPTDSLLFLGCLFFGVCISCCCSSSRSASSPPMVRLLSISSWEDWGLTRVESCGSTDSGATGTGGIPPTSSSNASAEMSLLSCGGTSGDSLTMEGWPRSFDAVDIRVDSRTDGLPDCNEQMGTS